MQLLSLRRQTWIWIVGISACCLLIGVVVIGVVVFSAANDADSRPDTTPIRWSDMIPQHKPLRQWKHIVIHHSATDTGSTDAIDRHHREENGWDGIGYHFVVGNGHGMRLGRVEYTFRWDRQREGAHAGGSDKSYNQQGIGICMIGNFDKYPPHEFQMQRSVELCAVFIENIPSLSIASIIGHKHVPGKDTKCPGELLSIVNFRRAVSELLRERADARQLKIQQELQEQP